MENISHDMYAEMRSRVYIGKATYYMQLDRFVQERADDNLPLLVLGESGSGMKIILLIAIINSFTFHKTQEKGK